MMTLFYLYILFHLLIILEIQTCSVLASKLDFLFWLYTWLEFFELVMNYKIQRKKAKRDADTRSRMHDAVKWMKTLITRVFYKKRRFTNNRYSRRIVQRSYVKVCVETLLSLKGLFVIHKWPFCNFNVVSTYSNFGVDYDVGTSKETVVCNV